MDAIEREALRLCLQLREKLAEIFTFLDDRTKEIERLSPPKRVKRQTPQNNLYVSMEANANSTDD